MAGWPIRAVAAVAHFIAEQHTCDVGNSLPAPLSHLLSWVS